LCGEDFAVVVDGAAEAKKRIEDVKKHVNGDHSLATEKGKRKVPITAAIGLSVWRPGTTAQQLLHAAAQAMYDDKKRVCQALTAVKP
jgi:GGDEF domain-containing protein